MVEKDINNITESSQKSETKPEIIQKKKKEKNQILHLQVIHQILILKMKKIIKTKKIL